MLEFYFFAAVVLPTSPTPANTVLNSNHWTEPLLSMSPSASHKTFGPSISIRHTPTQIVQQTTVSSSCEPTSPLGVPCTPNACKNGGTCVTPGNYCKCQKNFAWHDCSVDVGKWTSGMDDFRCYFTWMHFTTVEVQGNISIGNHTVSSSIWNKFAREFFKNLKLHDRLRCVQFQLF